MHSQNAMERNLNEKNLNQAFSTHQWILWAAPVAQLVKNLPAMQETWVRSLGWDDAMDKEMATHSSILAWEIPWTEGLGGLQSMGSQRVGHEWGTNTYKVYSAYLSQ